MSEQHIVNGRYEIGELIGRGGMADVYMGKDIRLGRQVAVKMMRPDLARDPQFQSRFQREAQSSAALNHPNIVAVFDTGEQDMHSSPEYAGISCPYMIMEYVDGKTLRALLREGDVSVEQAVKWTYGVLEAVSFSHENSIVHRDIKPANVMVTTSGDIKVMDFGIARALSDSSATMTQTQAVVGTAQYLSPEQARGETVDYRSDLYSVGCLLFELLTGRPPFVGDSPVSVAYQHVREEPPVPSTINPEISPALDSVLAKALAKDREDRFQTGSEFHQALTNAYERGIAVTDEDEAPTQVATTVIPPALPVNTDDNATMAMAAVSAQEDPFTPKAEFAADDDAVDEVMDTQDAEDPDKKNNKKVWITILVLLLIGALGVGGWYLWEREQQRIMEENQVTVPDVSGMNETEAQNALTTAGLRPIIENRHDDDFEAGDAIGTTPQAGEILQRYDEITLLISMGPDQVMIPEDLKGASEATVRDTLEGLGLQISSVDYVNSATIERDRLVDTNPSLGSTVAYGSTVSLSMSSGQVSVPDVTGMSESEARAALEADDVGLNVTTREEETDQARPGTVLSQDPSGGGTANAGSTVTLTIAKEPPSPTPTPTPTEEDSPEPDPSENNDEGSGNNGNNAGAAPGANPNRGPGNNSGNN